MLAFEHGTAVFKRKAAREASACEARAAQSPLIHPPAPRSTTHPSPDLHFADRLADTLHPPANDTFFHSLTLLSILYPSPHPHCSIASSSLPDRLTATPHPQALSTRSSTSSRSSWTSIPSPHLHFLDDFAPASSHYSRRDVGLLLCGDSVSSSRLCLLLTPVRHPSSPPLVHDRRHLTLSARGACSMVHPLSLCVIFTSDATFPSERTPTVPAPDHHRVDSCASASSNSNRCVIFDLLTGTPRPERQESFDRGAIVPFVVLAS